MAIDNTRHIQRQELIDVLKMILTEDKDMKQNLTGPSDAQIESAINKAIAEGKISAYDDTELTEKVDSLIDTEKKIVTSDVATNLMQGYVNNTGDINSSNAQYSYTEKISVKPGDVIFVSSTNVVGDFNYEKMQMRFGCVYNGVNVVADKGWVSAITEYTIPDGITDIIVSVDVQNYSNHIVKKTVFSDVSKLKDSANSVSVEKMLSEQNLVRSKTIGGDFLTYTSDTLLDGNGIFLEENSIAKNKVLSFSCNISSIGSGVLRLGHGKTTYNGSYVEIDSTNVTIYKYTWQKELQKQQAHGLTLSDYIMVNIKVGADNKEKLTLMTSTGMFTLDGIYWTGRSGQIFAEVEGFNVTNATLNWYCDDYKKSIYAFGDSYFETTGTVRWTAYLLANGYDNLLMDNFGGRFSDKAYESFVNSLKHGTPKFALWCMGQNDPDNASTGINTKWKTATDNFIKKCEEKGIIPILATIPNVRGGAVGDSNIDAERTHNYKNDYVKNSEHRYIDFAKAVGAYDSKDWYAGMLSSDGVHPDVLGAKALYMQAIIDFPELMFNN